MILDTMDYLEALFTGKWKYLGWMLIGSLIAGTLRILYGLWIKKLAKNDAVFAEKNQSIPIKTFKKKANWILLSIVMSFVLFALTTWITVEILKGIESSPDWLNLVIVLSLTLFFLIFTTIQSARFARLSRRIKFITKTRKTQEPPLSDSSTS